MAQKHRRVIWAGAFLLTVAAARPAAGLLTDMASHWAGPLVGALEARGIVSGDEDLSYHPERSLTRAQLAKLMVNGLGFGDDARLLAHYPSRFADIPTWHWANGYIESLAESGAMEGYPDGRFVPNDEVTRAQLAVVFVRAAGLADQARVVRFENTGYADDAQVPDWARGYVRVARTAGLMAGFEDNTFRPLTPVTRAEGATALFRLLALKGRMFHLSGTLLKFDPISRVGVVRDSTGAETNFTMNLSAQYFRGGVPSYSGQIKPLDQVWIVLGPDGEGTFLDARFSDLLANDLRIINDNIILVARPGGGSQTFNMGPGMLAFLNGKPVAPSQIKQSSLAYLLLDSLTGDVRLLDALNVSVVGQFAGFDRTSNIAVVVGANEELKLLPLAADVTYVRNGAQVKPEELLVDDRIQIVQNDAGAVIYVLAER